MIDFQRSLFSQTFNSIHLAFILLIAPAIYAQDTTYYDADWRPVSRPEAVFFFTPPSKISSPSPASIAVEARELPKFLFDFPFLKVQDLIGKKVAIWSSLPTYPVLYKRTDLDWPADDSIFYGVQPSREKQSLREGDTARIVWVFERFHEQNGARVYIVKSRSGYEIIGGSGLTMPDVLKPPQPPSPPQPPPPLWLALHTGLLFQSKFAGDLSVMLAHEVKSHDIGAGFHGWKTGIEMTRTGTIGYKFGYDFDLAPFGIRGDLLAIPTGHRIDWRAVPQIGINLMYISLTYGYALHLVGPREHDVGNHRASMSIYAPLLNLRRSAKQGS